MRQFAVKVSVHLLWTDLRTTISRSVLISEGSYSAISVSVSASVSVPFFIISQLAAISPLFLVPSSSLPSRPFYSIFVYFPALYSVGRPLDIHSPCVFPSPLLNLKALSNEDRGMSLIRGFGSLSLLSYHTWTSGVQTSVSNV